MKKKAVTRMLASILAGVLASTALTGCTFGFASDPDDPNEVKEKEPIDTSTDTFQYDSSLNGTNITLLNSKAEIQSALEEMAAQFQEKAGVHIEVMPVTDGDSPYTKVVSLYNSGTPATMAILDTTDVIALAEEKGLAREEVSDFSALPGNGLVAKRNGKELCGGNRALITKKAFLSKQMEEQAAKLSEEGKTPLFFSEDGKMLGMIAVADVIKEDSPRAVKELQNMGIRVVMLTGDNERTARAIGAQAGVDEVIAGVLPDGKEAVISRLKEKGKVAMVGDGINDAPALTSADIGIAIGAGTDIAIDAADVVLMKSRLSDVPAAIRLSRATLRNIHENLFWAFIYNIIGIPLAAGVWIPLFGWKLNPMFGAAAMSLSSFCVVTNALRLNLFRMHDASKDKRIKNEIPKEDLKRVTEAFYMVDKSRSRVKGSVGLGLALCQKIADIHGFQLEITSHLGKGTIISVLW